MRVYIAGPMRGIPRWNFDAFDKAKIIWLTMGHQPVSPADVDRALGIDPDGPIDQVDETFTRRAIQLDIGLIMYADAIALLPGWADSSGVAVELALAQFLKLPVYDAFTCKQIYPLEKPWRDS